MIYGEMCWFSERHRFHRRTDQVVYEGMGEFTEVDSTHGRLFQIMTILSSIPTLVEVQWIQVALPIYG